jgi:hypothetical protein
MSEIVDAEIVEESVESHGQEVAVAGFARPVISPDEAAQAAQELRQLIAKVLVKGKHYQQIKGRDVLLKAGAEELAKVFGMQTGYTELETTQTDDVFLASVKCTISKGGLALAESYGFYDSSERKGANKNTVVKMAQKRAYVGAVMSATGTSELFTQDIEDEQAAPLVADRMSSAQERLLLKELFAQKGGKTIIEAGDWLRDQGEKADSQLWVARQVIALALKPDPLPEKMREPESVAKEDNLEPELPVEPPKEGEIVGS